MRRRNYVSRNIVMGIEQLGWPWFGFERTIFENKITGSYMTLYGINLGPLSFYVNDPREDK